MSSGNTVQPAAHSITVEFQLPTRISLRSNNHTQAGSHCHTCMKDTHDQDTCRHKHASSGAQSE